MNSPRWLCRRDQRRHRCTTIRLPVVPTPPSTTSTGSGRIDRAASRIDSWAHSSTAATWQPRAPRSTHCPVNQSTTSDAPRRTGTPLPWRVHIPYLLVDLWRTISAVSPTFIGEITDLLEFSFLVCQGPRLYPHRHTIIKNLNSHRSGPRKPRVIAATWILFSNMILPGEDLYRRSNS